MIDDLAMLTGMVLSGAHGIYDVHTTNGVLRCTLRGKLKKSFVQTSVAQAGQKRSQSPQRLNNLFNATSYRRVQRREQPVQSETSLPTRLSVGDHVKVRKLDEASGLIEEILPRQSELTRRDVASSGQKLVQQTLLANLDQVIIVLAVAQPQPHFGFLDRYLAICEAAQLCPLICLNKIDLPHESLIEEEAALYQRLGYQIIFTSTQTGKGIDQLRHILKEHISLFTGPSGVGKSSLLNALEPSMTVRTEMVSGATGKGRHTTTSSQLYPLSDGGWLADSAGIRALAAWNIPLQDLAWCFVEFRPYLGACTYADCSHVDEQGCRIIQAGEDQAIELHRYRSYVRMYTGEER